MMDASAWNLHSDGTSKDHKKISVYTGAEEETFNLDLGVPCRDAVDASTLAGLPSCVRRQLLYVCPLGRTSSAVLLE